jgi:hypothetical protein
MARPTATRCRWPPDSCFGRRSSIAEIPSTSAARSTLCRISALSIFRSLSPNSRFSRTVMCGYRA